ncbi:ras-related and estrogen-regulated growth inhibitor isoform X3 [Takifugu rubripes]|uniref:ras-related and estrogen-regulated growth inhibitor isoform X3 n=1 Tax=Takifugu rubripes TaxID=31033 RepID=UPI0011460528|nr:ras-related and estrogen-regulated growth inhibitor-like isoform X3 [Takifugu rubripes]
MVPVKILILGSQKTGKTDAVEWWTRKLWKWRFWIYLENSVSLLESSILWADGFLLLYSITQRLSFLEIPGLKRLIDQTKKSLVVPTVLVGNKADLEIGREVTTEEGQKLAEDLRCSFKELSVAEAVLAVEAAVIQLIRMVLDQQRPLPDRRSYMLTVRHALTRKLTRSKTMQW